MPLPLDELDNRIKAAGRLRGLGMRQIRGALEDYGAEATLAEAMVRGEKDQNRRNIRDLAEALDVPTWWFEVPEREALFARGEPAEATALAQVVRRLAFEQSALVAEIRRLQGLPAVRPTTQPSDRRSGGTTENG